MNIFLKNPILHLSAASSALVLSSSAAFAQQGSASTIAEMANTAGANIYSTSVLISTGSYIAGIAFALAGLLSLKKHAEEPGREPITKGLGRLGVGAMLCAMPFIINVVFNSMSINGQDASVGVSGSINRF